MIREQRAILRQLYHIRDHIAGAVESIEFGVGNGVDELRFALNMVNQAIKDEMGRKRQGDVNGD